MAARIVATYLLCIRVRFGEPRSLGQGRGTTSEVEAMSQTNSARLDECLCVLYSVHVARRDDGRERRGVEREKGTRSDSRPALLRRPEGLPNAGFGRRRRRRPRRGNSLAIAHSVRIDCIQGPSRVARGGSARFPY